MLDMHSHKPFLKYRFWKSSWFSYELMQNSIQRKVSCLLLQYQHVPLGYSRSPQSTGYLPAEEQPRTLCCIYQPSLIQTQGISQLFFILWQESLNRSAVFLWSLTFSKYLEIPVTASLLPACISWMLDWGTSTSIRFWVEGMYLSTCSCHCRISECA